MALVLNDRVKETTTTTGTGTVNLAGAETGFETFVAGIGNSNTTYYAIVHQSAAEFEVGLGTVTDASPDTLARTTVISSSNSDSAVNFSSGTKDVFCTMPASKAVHEDASGNVTLPGTLDVNGQELILDADADTSITADTDDQIDFRVGAVDAMTLTNSNLVLKGTTPTLTIGDAGAEDTKIVFDGNAQDYYIGLDDSADDLIIGKGSTVGTTPAVVIDENLKVGIGGAPEQNLHIYCDSGDEGILLKGTGNTSHALTMDANRSSAGGGLGELRGLWNGTEVARIVFRGGDDTTNKDDGLITFSTSTADNISERMRIASDGKVGIGLTSPAAVLDIKSSGTTSTAFRVVKSDAGQNLHAMTEISGHGRLSIYDASENEDVRFDSNGNSYFNGGSVGIGNTSPSVALGVTGAIIASDNITAYGTPSDIRLKENIVVIDNALDKVKQLKGITYDLKSDGNRLTGLIAQDLEKVLPEAVYETSAVDDANDKHLAIRYGNTVGLLVEAIKEQQEQIETLTAKVKELEDK